MYLLRSVLGQKKRTVVQYKHTISVIMGILQQLNIAVIHNREIINQAI